MNPYNDQGGFTGYVRPGYPAYGNQESYYDGTMMDGSNQVMGMQYTQNTGWNMGNGGNVMSPDFIQYPGWNTGGVQVGVTPVMPPSFQPNQNGSVNSGNQNTQTPPSAPPNFVPEKRASANTRAVDSGTVNVCTGQFTYIWLDNGMEFWMYPIFVGNKSVFGFRWMNNFGWVYFGISTDRIDSFFCYS